MTWKVPFSDEGIFSAYTSNINIESLVANREKAMQLTIFFSADGILIAAINLCYSTRWLTTMDESFFSAHFFLSPE